MEKAVQESKVTYETACLAKELGFDEICYYHFGSDGKEFESRHPTGSRNSQWVKCVARPTQAHLQKWLREVHNIIVIVSPIHTTEESSSLIKYWYYIVDVEDESDEEVFYGTWEEALEIGLQEVLKLLKQEVPNNI